MLQVRHDAVHNVRFGCEKVYCIHVAIGRAFLLNVLDIGNLLAEDVIFLDDIGDELPARLIDNEELPL